MSNATPLAERPVIPGSEATVREISRQPDVWHEAAANVSAQRLELAAFLEPLLERPGTRIILTGAGTSAFTGDIAAPTLARFLNRRVDSIATTFIVSNPREAFAEDVPTLLVSFARSGNSPESVAATRLADELLTDVSHLILTCDKFGRLFAEHEHHDKSTIVLMPERANDEGFAMTSSFTSMLLSVLLVFGAGETPTVDALASAGNHILQTRQGEVDALAAQGFTRVVYLGSGSFAGLARESALKLLELTAGRVDTYFDSSLGFRHGPKAVLDDRTLVVVFVSSDPYTRRYDLDIIAELRATVDPEHVVAIASAPLPSSLGDAWILDDLAGLDDAFLPVAYVVAAQLLGLSFALGIGTTPDNPFPAGNVNRVVQGVMIHPLSGHEGQ